LIFIVGFVVALSMLEINVGPLLAAIGAAGFIIGFALQGTLSNFAAGIMILIYRPYDVGDFVDIGGTFGTVDAMTIVSTTLMTLDNQKVVVPNNMIWGDKITNVTGSDQRRVDMVFGIGYSDDIAKAQKILEDILQKHEAILEDPEPVVKVHELADSSVNFAVRPWVKTEDYWDVYWDVTRTVKERFDAEGVSIPFPQRDVHLHQVATT
ncbi:MAG: mechanosensitive ion channel family protein, partial [Desulfobacterales bacterium]|nr:mechanosensitive ion channel family protein [Desulfobacterales bacterium]MDH4011627.1 mechanosensitive ion channel family protein [Desulfobacterales bacterium]